MLSCQPPPLPARPHEPTQNNQPSPLNTTVFGHARDRTASRQLSEVKHLPAQVVLRWVTTLQPWVLHIFARFEDWRTMTAPLPVSLAKLSNSCRSHRACRQTESTGGVGGRSRHVGGIGNIGRAPLRRCALRGCRRRGWSGGCGSWKSRVRIPSKPLRKTGVRQYARLWTDFAHRTARATRRGGTRGVAGGRRYVGGTGGGRRSRHGEWGHGSHARRVRGRCRRRQSRRQR